MKRLLSTILSISMLLALLPGTAIALDETEATPVVIGDDAAVLAVTGSTTKPERVNVSVDLDSFSEYELIRDVPYYMFSGSEETISLSYPTEAWKTIDSIRVCNGWGKSEYIVVNNNGNDTFTFTVPAYDDIVITSDAEHDSFKPYTVTIGEKSVEITDKTRDVSEFARDGAWNLSAYNNGIAELYIYKNITDSIVSEGPLKISAYNHYTIQGSQNQPAIDVAGDLELNGSGSLTVRGTKGQSAIRVGKRLHVYAELNAEGGEGADAASYGTSAYFLGDRDVSIRSSGNAKALVGDRRWLDVPEYHGAQITADTDACFTITAQRYTLTLEDTDETVLKKYTDLLYDDRIDLSEYVPEKSGKVLVGWRNDNDFYTRDRSYYVYDDQTLTAEWAEPGDGVAVIYQDGNDTTEDTIYYDVIPAGQPLPNTRDTRQWDDEAQDYVLMPVEIVAWMTDALQGTNGIMAGACYLSGNTVPEGGFDGNRILYSVDAGLSYERYLYDPYGGAVQAGGDVLVQAYRGRTPDGSYFAAPEGKYLAGWSLSANSNEIDREIASYPQQGQSGTVTRLYAVWKDAVPYTRASFVAELMAKKFPKNSIPSGITIPEDCASLDAETQKRIGNAIFQGYVNTDESGNFRPDEPLTRAQAAMIVTRATRGKNAPGTMTGTGKLFTDVPADNWACGAIEFLANERVMFGTSGEFAPNENAKTGDVIWVNSHGFSYQDGNSGSGGDSSQPITVTLKGNEGTCDGKGEVEIQTKTHDGISLGEHVFTREGYVFDCWLNEKNEEKYGAGEWINLDEDTTLVAQWVEIGAGIQLADPSNLEWGKDYRTWWDADHVRHEYEDIPGMVSWRINLPSQNKFKLYIYRVGENNTPDEEVYYTTWNLGSTRRVTYHSSEDFIRSDLTGGTYYFTVQAIGDGETYLDSEVVKSENWSYVRPNKQLPAPTGLKWDAEEDTKVRWSVADFHNVLGYEVKFYIKDSSMETGYRMIGSTWHSSADYLESEIYDNAVQHGGENDYYFTVRTISRNINEIRTSADSPMSAARHLPRAGGNDEQGQAKQESVDSAANNLESVLAQLENDAIDEETKQELKEQAVESTKDTLKNSLGVGTVKDALLAADNSAADSNAAKVEKLIRQAEELSGVKTKAQAKIDASYHEATATEQEKKEVRQLQEAAAGASMIGAALNAEGNSSVELQISKPDQKTELVIPEAYDNTLVVSFSMDLVGKSEGKEDVVLTKKANGDSKQLDIPVKLRIPVPTGINPQFLVILHHDMSGNVDEILMPYIDCDEGGKAYATFVLTHFSDFSFVEARVSFEDDGGTVKVTAKLPEHANTVQAFCAAYDENGKLLAISDTKQLNDGTADLKLACALADIHHGKVFFVDADGKPVASAELFERES